MAKANLYIILVAFFVISSCNLSNDTKDQLESVSQKLEPVKSGIIYMKSTKPVRDNDIERIIYFDDYGSKVRIESTASIKVSGQTVSNTHITINANGYSNIFDPEKRSGTKTKINRYINSTAVTFSAFTLNHMHKEEGTEEIAGKTCDVYTILYPEIDSSKFRYAVWNSIKLRETISSAEFSYDYIATKFDEDVEIQPVMFLVPDSIVISEPMADSLRYSHMNDTIAHKFPKPNIGSKAGK